MACIEIENLNENFKRGAQIESDKFSMTFMVTIRKRGSDQQIVMSMHGLDIANNQDFNWFAEPLAVGTELKITISENQPGLKQQVEVTKVEPIPDKIKLNNYYLLKKELSAKGLI